MPGRENINVGKHIVMKKYILPLITTALAVALLFTIQRCNNEKTRGDINADALTDTVSHYQNRLGTQTASIKTLQLDKKQLQDILLNKDKDLAALASEFAKVKSIVQANTETNIPHIGIKFPQPITVHDTTVVLPPPGAVFTDWYSLGYEITKDSLKIEPFKTWADLTVITGTKRKWFLGKETVTTDIAADNPHFEISAIKSAEVVVPVPWYKKWYVWAAGGLIGGFIIAK